ncbi:MAG TPA: exo-beta-N-acetylmuramidase NamZ domain-containing protein [Alphaproteobacteria bacterium]|nr:exo-beta-N-acetylmuramidase NamZ domain-containing protein [Alphaproteobacteria bacterium]
MKFPRKAISYISIIILAVTGLSAAGAPAPKKKRPAAEVKETANFSPVDLLVQEQINDQAITGAVLVVGHGGKIVHQKAFGLRATSPRAEAMTLDTIFDLASLTKVVATTPSVMRLIQYGQVRLDEPVAHYIPDFGMNGKDAVTVRQLLTHYSGLRPDIDLNPPWAGRDSAFRLAHEEKLQAPQGSIFIYSDTNFIVLGELVQRLSGMPLDQYASVHIFQPLGMKHTRFLPPPEWKNKIAETFAPDRKQILRGVVHDPRADRMGGVAGHAGVFSTAGDLALYAQALISRKQILDGDIIEKMTTPQQPPNATEVRGLGWDIDSSFSSNRGSLLPVGSFGHTGYTGTSLWIDPYTNTYVILLTNSVLPRQGPAIISLRARVATAVAALLKLDVTAADREKQLAITGYNEAATASRRLAARNGHVLTGIDVLEQDNFASLKKNKEQMTIGLLTNNTGVDGQGRRTIDALAAAPGIKLAAIFAPEHGIFGAQDDLNVQNTTDSVTGVPVYSMYGGTDAKKRPPPDILKTLDAVVFDIQDAGTRYYTYPATLGYLLEAAAQTNTEVIVLDRPDPVNGSFVQGPISQTEFTAFTNYHPIPIRHGMTMGELAQMYNAERKIGAQLRVIPMQGWLRGDWFDSTGIVWINTSPNLRSVNEAELYPGVGIVEGTNVSVGRGTDTPFEVLGAPWIEPRAFSDYLNARLIPGARFVPVTFTPVSGPYQNQLCKGVNIIVTDRTVLDAPEMGIELAAALKKLYSDNWKIERMLGLLANRQVFDAVVNGDDPRAIAQGWQDDLEKFKEIRQKYLIYK